MLIRSYGLFWQAEEIEWNPGKGKRWYMLGRRGMNRPGLHVVDFRDQRGLYVLYGNDGTHYVGLARERGIGDRLKDHRRDHHDGLWDRFSWFGFRHVLKSTDGVTGLRGLSSPATYAAGELNSVIADMEALLIKALGCPSNVNHTSFPKGEEWHQVTRLDDERGLLDRAGVTV